MEITLDLPAIVEIAEFRGLALSAYSVDSDGAWRVENQWDGESHLRVMPSLVFLTTRRGKRAVVVQAGYPTDIPRSMEAWAWHQVRRSVFRKKLTLGIGDLDPEGDPTLTLYGSVPIPLTLRETKRLGSRTPDPETCEIFAEAYVTALSMLWSGIEIAETITAHYRKLN